MEPVPLRRVKPLPKETLTFEEFLAWADEDTWAEWVNGRVVMWPLVTARHQDLGGLFLMLLAAYGKGTPWAESLNRKNNRQDAENAKGERKGRSRVRLFGRSVVHPGKPFAFPLCASAPLR